MITWLEAENRELGLYLHEAEKAKEMVFWK
jgi:hypothetical protein